MTLRSFHLFFITIAVLLTLFFGFFEWTTYQATKATSDLIVSGVSFVSAVVLAIYGIRFRAKTATRPSN